MTVDARSLVVVLEYSDEVDPYSGSREVRSADLGRQRNAFIGVTHVAGKYHLTDKDFLNEGADEILALGSRVIKLYLKLPPERDYPFNSQWPSVRTLVDLAGTPYYRAVFEKPFTSYILTTYSAGRPDHYWRHGVTDEQARDEEEQFYRLARYLLATYRATGKTFVLQHWEGDWAIRGSFDPKADPTPQAVAGMIRWLGAAAGRRAARAEAGAAGVRVFHAAEVNLVKIALKEGRPTVTDRVLPRARVDLVSYSAWDTQDNPALLREALDYIARHVPDRRPLGQRNVYLGEFGLPENEFPRGQVRRTISEAMKTAIDWGCPYVVYWQLYCNEARRRPVKTSDDVRGFWLLRPDGSKALAWKELHDLLSPPVAVSEVFRCSGTAPPGPGAGRGRGRWRPLGGRSRAGCRRRRRGPDRRATRRPAW